MVDFLHCKILLLYQLSRRIEHSISTQSVKVQVLVSLGSTFSFLSGQYRLQSSMFSGDAVNSKSNDVLIPDKTLTVVLIAAD